MQLVYDFLYKRHFPIFLIFLCMGHSDYPVDSNYPLKYSIPIIYSSSIILGVVYSYRALYYI